MLGIQTIFAAYGVTMDYLEPQGFLGTGASLLADLTLLAYILLIVPGMIVGYVFARQGKHRPHHKWAMIIITVVNWLLIFFLMIAAYRFDVSPISPSNRATRVICCRPYMVFWGWSLKCWRPILFTECCAKIRRWRRLKRGASRKISFANTGF